MLFGRKFLAFMTLLILGVSLSLLLGGCSTIEERPYKVGTETRTITLERSHDAQAKCAAQLAAPPGWKVVACAFLDAKSCTIRMQPDASDDTLGHEARHCFDGAWHR